MAEVVAGDWKEFAFELAANVNEEEITQHLRESFDQHEVMNAYVGPKKHSANKNPSLMVRTAISHGCSLLVREKKTGEVAGIQLVLDKRQTVLGSSASEAPSSRAVKISSFLHQIESETEEVFKRDFKCDFYAEVFISSVAAKYRGRGLGTELYIRLLALLRAKRFPVLRSTFTSELTRKIGARLGFVEIGRKYFKDALDENKEKLFPTAGDGKEEYAAEIAYIL